jgi:uncharacterized protein YggE
MGSFLDDVQKKRLVSGVFTVLVLLAVFLAVESLNAIKSSSYIGKGTYPANVISVSGTGEVMATPDVASFSFSVTEEAKTVKDAQDAATAKTNSAIDALKASGIDEKDIKTTDYSSYPKYEYSGGYCTNGYCPAGKQTLTGYEVSQTITVKVRKTDTAGDVLTKIGGLNVANISGLSFVVDDMDAVQAQARDKAVADAKAKASALAKSLGVKLDKIVNFYETGDYPTPVAYGGVAMDAKVMSNEAATPPQLPTGENKIVSNVTITYEIR